jgi:hypothetical protein
MDSILVVSEEPALAETLGSELPGITVAPARFREASARLKAGEYRLMVIDEGGEAGQIPDGEKTPVIKLARPVVLRELLYSIRERLQGKNATSREDILLSPGFRLSPSERLVRGDDGTHITLTEKETGLLQCLLAAGGQTVARDLLLKDVWGYSDDIATHTLETHIYRLRGKLRQASEQLDIASSDEGGYSLKC